MSWARDAVSAIRKIVRIEDRMEALTVEVRHLADGYTDLDRRLVWLEAKFDLIEKWRRLGVGLSRQNRVSTNNKEQTS